MEDLLWNVQLADKNGRTLEHEEREKERLQCLSDGF